MKILLSAKNAMGEVADYEVEADTQQDLVRLIHRLYGLPGMTQVEIKEDYLEVVGTLPTR